MNLEEMMSEEIEKAKAKREDKRKAKTNVVADEQRENEEQNGFDSSEEK